MWTVAVRSSFTTRLKLLRGGTKTIGHLGRKPEWKYSKYFKYLWKVSKNISQCIVLGPDVADWAVRPNCTIQMQSDHHHDYNDDDGDDDGDDYDDNDYDVDDYDDNDYDDDDYDDDDYDGDDYDDDDYDDDDYDDDDYDDHDYDDGDYDDLDDGHGQDHNVRPAEGLLHHSNAVWSS